MTRGKIVEATSGLNDMRVRLEQYFADNRQYPTGCVASAAGPAPAGKVYLPRRNPELHVQLRAERHDVHRHRDGKASVGMAGFVYMINQASAQYGEPSPRLGARRSCEHVLLGHAEKPRMLRQRR